MAVKETIDLQPTSLRHIFLCDIDDSGLLKEIALVKKFTDGTIYYIDIEPLHAIDKSRIKKIVSSSHADKYELWELMAESKLSNGMNALDFFHMNTVKVKRPKGARAATGGLEQISGQISDDTIGANFSNPAEASLDQTSKQFR